AEAKRLEEIRQREVGIREALESGRGLARQKRFDEGLRVLTTAIERFGSEPELAALRSELELGLGLASARACLAQSRSVEALKILDALGASPDVDALRTQAQQQLAAQKRAEAIE